jgi:hypothetical protein
MGDSAQVRSIRQENNGQGEEHAAFLSTMVDSHSPWLRM